MSVEQLASCDPSELSEETGISKHVLRRLRLKARSLISGEIYMVNMSSKTSTMKVEKK